MSDLQETVGAVIRQARREQQMTLKELAEAATISVVYLGEIERGKKYPSSLVLEHVAAALEMTVSDLLERVVDELRVQAQVPVVRAIGFPMPQRAIGFPMPQRANGPRASMSAASVMGMAPDMVPDMPREPEQALARMLVLMRRGGSAVA